MTWSESKPASGRPAGGGRPSGLPARGTTRPPFPLGNTMHASHGATMVRVYEPLAEQLVAGLLDRRPDLAGFPEEVAAWARAEARVQLLDRYAAENGLLASGGDPKPFTKLLTSFEASAARARAALGLTPFTETQLAKERAGASMMSFDLGALALAGQQALADRHADALTASLTDVAGELLSGVIAEGGVAWARAAEEQVRTGDRDAGAEIITHPDSEDRDD